MGLLCTVQDRSHWLLRSHLGAVRAGHRCKRGGMCASAARNRRSLHTTVQSPRCHGRTGSNQAAHVLVWTEPLHTAAIAHMSRLQVRGLLETTYLRGRARMIDRNAAADETRYIMHCSTNQAAILHLKPARIHSSFCSSTCQHNVSQNGPIKVTCVIIYIFHAAMQGTLALELLEQVPHRLDAILVCVSGGGMISGIAAAAKALQPDIAIIAAEPSGSSPILCPLALLHLIVLMPGLRSLVCQGFPYHCKLLQHSQHCWMLATSGSTLKLHAGTYASICSEAWQAFQVAAAGSVPQFVEAIMVCRQEQCSRHGCLSQSWALSNHGGP